MRYLYLLIFCSLASSTLAQTSWIKKDGPEGGVVTDIEYYPGTSTVWAIVDNYVYRSTDDGNTWVRPGNAIFQNNTFNDIEITNNTIYFLGYDFLYTSIDQGSTLVQVAKGKFFQANKIKRLPLSGTLVILSSSPSIYFSTSNGTAWTAGATGNYNDGWLAVNNSDQIFIIGSDGGGTFNVFRSTDNGATFDPTTNFIPTSHVYSLTNNEDGSLVYAVTDTDIRVSTDGAASTSLNGGEIAGTTFSDLIHASMVIFSRDGLGMYFVDSYNHKLYSKAVGAPVSDWKLRASNFPNSGNDDWPSQPIYSASAKDFPSITSSKVVFGTTYGVVRSVTGGASNFDANTGIARLAPRQLLAGRNEGQLLMNDEVLGVMRSQNSGDSWTRTTSIPQYVSSMTTVVSSEDPEQGMSHLAVAAGNLYSSTNDGDSWNKIKDGIGNSVQGGNNNRVFYTDGLNIYYSNNGGLDWSSALAITNFSGILYIDDVYVPTTTDVIYALCEVSSQKYYKIDLTYNESSDITAAVATQLADPPFGASNVYSGNGKLYVYQQSDDKLAVYDGTSWSAAKTVPEGNLFVPPNNGYVFVASNSSSSKLYLSRDDGDHFINTDLPATHNGFSVSDVAVTPQGYVFLSFYRNYMLQGKNKVVLPQKPTGLTQVAVLGNAMVFKWDDNANNETAYRVMRSSDGGANYSVIGTVRDVCTPNSGETGVVYFTDNSVVGNASYKYKVKAFNEAGDTEGTEELSVIIPAVVLPNFPDNRSWSAQNSATDPDVLWGVQTPRIVGIQNMGNGRYSVTDILDNTLFTSNPKAGEVYVNGTTTVLGAMEGSGNFSQVFANGTGTWNTTDEFTIEWVSCQNPAYTERITYTLQANDPVPDVPAIQALIKGNSQIEIVWSSILYAKDYILERSTTSESTGFTQVGSAINYPTTSVLDNDVTEGTTYYYRLKARNANSVAGVSDPSEVVTVEFKKPMFIVSETTVSSFVSATLGSYWADFDDDGNDDLLTVNGSFGSVAVATVTIFKNLGNGNFEVKSPVIDPLAYGFSAVSDINGDGKMDLSLAVAETAQVDFYKGNGDFTFTKFSNTQLGELPNAIVSERQGIMWGDINNDGRLDVILSGDYSAAIDDRLTVCTQNSNGTFSIADAGDLSDITSESFSTFWIDYNNDTFIDVVVSGLDPTGLYRNNGDGTFTLVPPSESGIALGGFGGVTAADFNNDDYMDLVCGGGENGSTVIYLNDKDGSFTLKDETAVSQSAFAIAPTAGDINNDGLVDLIVPGFFSLPTQVFINNSSGSSLTFLPIENEKVNDARFSHIGAAFGDYDKNGFLDLAMGTVKQFDDSDEALTPAENYLFKNTNTTGNWLQVKLVGKTANKSALGARITVTAGGKTFSREVVSSTSFVSLNSLTQHFGLGSATSITKVEVKWPTSPVIVQTISNPAINTIITINENADPDPPVFGNPMNTPATANKSSLAQTISVPVSDNKGVIAAEMFVRSVSGDAFVSVSATSILATTAEFELKASAFDASGVQYYFRAEDQAGNFALSPADAPAHVYTTLVNYTGSDAQIPASLIGSGGTASGWKVIAIPFDLGSNNGVQTVFDELTGTIKVDYRIVTYTETPEPAWQDYPDKFSTIDRGAGYMINVKTPVTLVVGDGLVAPSNTRDNLFQLELKAGWNMIGNPYLEGIDWTNVVAYNTITGTGTTFKKFSGGSYSNASSLAPYEGGFVHMDAAATVSIPFNGQTSPGRIEAPSFGPNDWLVPIEVKQGDVTNTFGGVGMHSSALKSYDAFDDINGPRWIDFVEMNFSHPEHPVKNFARDVVPVSDEFEWKFEFDSNIPGVATMTWDNETYATRNDLYLYDEDTQTPVNMRERNSYSFDAGVSRNFRILYGCNALSNIIPSKVMLGLAHPNPTSNSATIGFSIPEKKGKMNVRLDVFDLTGRRVGTLANGEFAAGFYTTEWRAKEDAPDGMYIFRLFAGDEILGGKIILRK